MPGILRSLLIYYGRPWQMRRLRRFYGRFIRAGDLCFDIGAHVGNRTRAWVGLGARVVAVEPQPALARLLRRWYGRHPAIILVEMAVAAQPGAAELWASRRTPTVSTLSPTWAAAVQRTPSFAHVRWEDRIEVPVTTLDALVARFGIPAFCKIDVEGYEAEVLAGLSQPLPQLSFEVIPAAVEVALACVQRLEALGPYRYNVAYGESLRLIWPQAATAATLTAWLRAQTLDAPSADVYAWQQEEAHA